jgi:putative transposase
MRRSKFTDEQISYAVKQMEAGVPLDELGRKYGVSTNTLYRWRQKFGGLTPSELRRLKVLEGECRKLKQLVADLSLDNQILKDALQKKL